MGLAIPSWNHGCCFILPLIIVYHWITRGIPTYTYNVGPQSCKSWLINPIHYKFYCKYHKAKSVELKASLAIIWELTVHFVLDLIGGIPTPLKNMSSSMGRMTSIYEMEHNPNL